MTGFLHEFVEASYQRRRSPPGCSYVSAVHLASGHFDRETYMITVVSASLLCHLPGPVHGLHSASFHLRRPISKTTALRSRYPCKVRPPNRRPAVGLRPATGIAAAAVSTEVTMDGQARWWHVMFLPSFVTTRLWLWISVKPAIMPPAFCVATAFEDHFFCNMPLIPLFFTLVDDEMGCWHRRN